LILKLIRPDGEVRGFFVHRLAITFY